MREYWVVVHSAPGDGWTCKVSALSPRDAVHEGFRQSLGRGDVRQPDWVDKGDGLFEASSVWARVRAAEQAKEARA